MCLSQDYFTKFEGLNQLNDFDGPIFLIGFITYMKKI